jgi:hypothetical protein
LDAGDLLGANRGGLWPMDDEIDAEGLVGPLPDRADRTPQLFGRQHDRAQDSETAGLRHRDHEIDRVGAAPHRRLDHRDLNAEPFTERGSE